MARIGNARLVIGLCLSVVASTAGCSSLDSGQPAGAALPGAVYAAGQIPLYPSATYESAMGARPTEASAGPR